MMTPIFERIAIIGAGLIGASIARAAKAEGAARAIALYDCSADVRARARALELGEVCDDAGGAVADADMVVLA
ncbi:MAG: NAD(P)-binding domain-containing protein, partial [Phycisphaerales bacterium]|nr:NAD(P)-binding domain-containing protein [Hyphomonadaceae bacterium]